MEFRILGPLEVTEGDGAISFDAPKQRALLGALLLHPNEVVSSERLIDELWGERPPATASKVVQNYVSQLRKALGPDLIVTRPPGYLLRVEDGALDAERFRRLTGEGRALAAKGEQARAEALYREALAVWRGPPLADVVFESFARNEVEQLEEERLGVLMDRIDCELALGLHDELVAELETLVERYPLRERLRAQLMLALYRAGRQAEALRAYLDARRTLVGELGLEPSEELQALERAILNHDTTLEAPPSVPPERPARQRFVNWRAIAVTALVLLAVASGLAFALTGREPTPRLLTSNSIGFIDAKSGRLTRGPFPVGREPNSLTVANDAIWVANYRDQTVTRIDRATGQPHTIPVGRRLHPTGLAAHQGTVWVWTLERLLVPIRFERAGSSGSLGREIARLTASIRRGSRRADSGGRITSGGGFLWVTVPPVAVIRVSTVEDGRVELILPDDGVGGAITYRNDEAWVGGWGKIFPIEARTPVAGQGVSVGAGRDIAFGAGSLWVVSGSDVNQRIGVALRRVDPRGRIVEATIDVGSDPVAVASAGGSIWVGSRSDRAIKRVDPATNTVVETIPLGTPPTALVPDGDGLWIAVG